MKILIIAMSESIHTARWIEQIADQGWDVHLFPSIDYGIVRPELRDITIHQSVYGLDKNKKVKIKGLSLYYEPAAFIVRAVLKKFIPDYRALQLKRLIKKLKPDIIHSMEFQHGAYLTYDALLRPVKTFPILKNIFQVFRKNDKQVICKSDYSNKRVVGELSKWIVTTWGSDIYLYGRLSAHNNKIKGVLAAADYFSCGCKREIPLVQKMGYKKEILPVFPNTGGFDLKKTGKLKQPGLVSERPYIMLKGYCGWVHRNLVGLRALERCSDLLQGYTVVIYASSDDMKLAAELFAQNTGVEVKILPYGSHDEIFSHFGKARLAIGLSISDGIPGAFLEAMVMGSFPIQSSTSCADEWVEDGKTALLVPPEDCDIVEKAIRRALTDEELVNNAAELNWKTVIDRLDASKLSKKAIDFYERVYQP